MRSTAASLTAGGEAIRRADWTAAEDLYRKALSGEASPEALAGLASAMWWQGDLAQARELREQAYTAFEARGDLGGAAWMAFLLTNHYIRVEGNMPAASGWASRSERLIAQAGPCAELGRITLIRAMAGGKWEELTDATAISMEIARRFGDKDFEILGLAYRGLAALVLGRVEEGIAALDEAMAVATSGQMAGSEWIGQVYCAMLTACEKTADYKRAAQWSGVAQEYVRRHGDAPMGASCRAFYGGVLAATGRWIEADIELTGSLQMFEAGARNMRLDALTRLATLRVRQGRTAEAAHLLEGFEEHQDSSLPIAALRLAAGKPASAAAVLERRISQLGTHNLESAPLLSLLVEAHLAQPDIPGADAAAAHLEALASSAGGDHLVGLAGLAAGRVAYAGGRDPVPHLDRALDHLNRAGMPWESAVARLEVARAMSGRNPEFAVSEARLAMATFELLGAKPDADAAAAVLRDLGVGGRTGPKRHGVLSRREDDVARLLGMGMSNNQIAALLFISHRTVEHHVSSILAKLGMSSRTEIAAYAARQLSSEPAAE